MKPSIRWSESLQLLLRWLFIIAAVATLFYSAVRAYGTQVHPIELLVFTGNSCLPCKRMEPVFERLSRSGVPLRKVDFESSPGPVAYFRVDRMPTMVLLRFGVEVRRWVGETPYETLAAEISHQFATPPIPFMPVAKPRTMSASDQVPPMEESPAVVLRREDGRDISQCSGFVVSHINAVGGEAIAVTNSHFVRDDVERRTTPHRNGINVIWPGSDRQKWPGVLMGDWPEADLCLISFTPNRLIPVARLAERYPGVGHRGQVLGWPGSLDPNRGVGVSRVFNLLAKPNEKRVEFDMRSRHGESGSAIYESGQVVAVLNAHGVGSTGYGIPVESLVEFLSETAKISQSPALSPWRK